MGWSQIFGRNWRTRITKPPVSGQISSGYSFGFVKVRWEFRKICRQAITGPYGSVGGFMEIIRGRFRRVGLFSTIITEKNG